ncbi:adhesion G protein-coupled receptor L3-like isoform X2 [Stylophora pistillata]|uniref:adhesion G protein-coupled receptor L3-like isoform X2 n=1 Tax=Stylophora pistillata TaxID=50429 RepID=UPI000C053ECD|nr:adhesion G protein-coupled receptor L3-like isoform X2 [Stylophora pistillata]
MNDLGRPRTESFLIKQHLILAVGLTQVVLLLTITAYRKEEGCQAMSVILHYSISSCFSWCLVDSLFLYFTHTNSFHPLRKNIYYLLLGWGFPVTVIAISLAIGFKSSGQSEPVLSIYYCWPSDHILWALVVPCLLIATLNLMILSVVLHHLRQPSYDICARAVLEKRYTRYGIRTNSIMLVGLCLGWIFGILSFRELNDVRFQLSFGLINGLQGIFLFFFHCVLNIDIKGYYQSGVHRCSHEDGCLTDRERSKRSNPPTHAQDLQAGSRRKVSSRSPVTDHVPLISVRAQTKSPQKEGSSRSQSSEPRNDPRPLEVTVVSKVESEPEVKRETSERPQKPDHDAYLSLPGTPEPHIPKVNVKETKRKSLPPELTPRKSSKNEVEGISKSATIASLASYTTPAADSEIYQLPQTEHLKVHSKVEKSHSEPMFPPLNDQTKPTNKQPASPVHSSTDTRKLSVQSSASTGGSGERKPRRTSRGTHQGASLNELESLFSNPVYVKPQRPSVSSLHGPRDGRERKHSYEMAQRPGSRTSSRNTEETML